MKRMIKALSLLLAVVLLTGCAPGWGEPSTIHEGGGFSFWFTGDGQITFTSPGEQSVITYHLNPRDIPIVIRSTDESVAVIDEYNVVTAVGPGECEIEAEVGNLEIGIVENTSIHVNCDFVNTADASTDEALSGDSTDAITAFENMKKYFHAGGNRWENMPDCFGGYDFNGTQNQTLTILLTDMTEENMTLFREACQTEDIVFRQVEYSYLEVWTAYQDAQALMTATFQESGTTVGYEVLLETWENRVKLTVPVEQEQAGKALAAEHPSIVLTLDAPILELADHEVMIENDSVVLTTTWPDY